MALTTLQSINAEIKQLEAQRKLVEKRDGEVPKALAVLQKFAKVLSPAQRRQVAKLIGETLDNQPESAGVEPVQFDDGLERVVVVTNARVRGESAVPGNHGHKDSVAWMSGCVHSSRRITPRLPIVSCVCS